MTNEKPEEKPELVACPLCARDGAEKRRVDGWFEANPSPGEAYAAGNVLMRALQYIEQQRIERERNRQPDAADALLRVANFIHENLTGDAVAAVQKSERASERPRTASAETRIENTYRDLIYGMAVGGYKYDPDDKKSKVPAEIAEDVQNAGRSITAETVREYLKKAEANR